MATRDISFDIETLGTKYNAAVISIGAVQFNMRTGEIGKTFYQNIDWSSAMQYGKAESDALKFWLTQPDEARQTLMTDAVSTAQALVSLKNWLPSSPRVWGNGSSFDVSMIERLYTDVRVKGKPIGIPWQYWDVRDLRTIKSVAEDFCVEVSVDREGVHHNAIDDAVHQAKIAIRSYKIIKGDTYD